MRRTFFAATALAILIAPLLVAQTTTTTTGPAFQNPGEISRHADGKLQAVINLSDADRNVPTTNMGTKHLRYFQGWDLTKPDKKVPASVAAFNPGPTLRARVGDTIQIMFLNTINDDNFQYSFVTTGKDSNPSYGCNQASNPAVYPAKDVFPNCLHGSSTANLHFHGTHTEPDAVGDNVLMQVMPDKTTSQKDWMAVFTKIFAGPIPQRWSDLPEEYRKRQETLVKAVDKQLWEADLQQIASGQFPQYVVGAFPNYFTLPDQTKTPSYTAGQSPGTHWYHAHKHGSTSLHSLNGLAGVFIIEGAYDDFIKKFYNLGASYGNFEKVIEFQLVNPDQNLERSTVNFVALGPGQLLINGQNTPNITMKPGEVQLWRVVNATNGATFTGVGPGVIGPDFFVPVDSTGKAAAFQFKQTAKDGVQFSPLNYSRQPFLSGSYPNPASGPIVPAAQTANAAGLMLAGGNRADVLVKAPDTPGATFTFNSNGAAVMTVTTTNDKPVTTGFPQYCPPNSTIASSQCWPDMPSYLKDLPAQQEYPHTVTFGWDAENGRPAAGGGRLTSNVGNKLPPHYTIDNRQFEQFGPIIDQCMPLGAIQDWVLLNQTTVSHPFHIHINPFQVVKVEAPLVNSDGTGFTYQTWPGPNDTASDYPWQDVVPIPAGVVLTNGQFIAGRVTIRQKFADFSGTWVLHCHILAHEDRGMMQLVRVVPANRYPSACQGSVPHHH